MRIGTWNLKLCPTPSSARGQAVACWLDEQAADVWMLTEVHRDWADRQLVVSPARGVGLAEKRWAGIHTALPIGELRSSGDPTQAGEEGLALARLQVDGEKPSSILVACSVLPWRGAGEYWPGLPTGQLAEFRHVLDHHVARIDAERLDGEPLIWGGDFNQPLTGPFWGATPAGADHLRLAFDTLGLVALTEHAEHLNGITHAIDHLTVSAELADQPAATVHRPAWDSGQLSDHAAYTADIRTPVSP